MPDVSDFNAWHAEVTKSSACNLIFQQALGLPAEVASNSLLTWSGIAEVAMALRLAPGQTLVDLACGRGGYGREVARRTGARLVGLDFSAVAVAVAIAARGGRRDRECFCVADFTALGLRDHSAHAVMCIDAIQFSDPPLAALRECRRILADGGRLAVTAWEPVGLADERLPERTRRMNLARDLADAGFKQVEVTAKPDWYAAERKLWEAGLQADANGVRPWPRSSRKVPGHLRPSPSSAASSPPRPHRRGLAPVIIRLRLTQRHDRARFAAYAARPVKRRRKPDQLSARGLECL